jgi:hypothetical protein
MSIHIWRKHSSFTNAGYMWMVLNQANIPERHSGGFVLIAPICGGYWGVETVEGYSSVQLCATVCSLEMASKRYCWRLRFAIEF